MSSLHAPVVAGEKVGELIYLINGAEVGRADLVAGENVEKADVCTMLEWMLHRWFS
ncbi:MAG: hypothetical protein IKU91_05915 [Anaerotignum sp.]|nr:hypothetical protein [Anaerotignum sp.]